MKCTVAHTAHQLKQEGTAVQWSELGLGSNEKMKKLAYNSGTRFLSRVITQYSCFYFLQVCSLIITLRSISRAGVGGQRLSHTHLNYRFRD